MQFSYASMGARNARKLGGQFMNGVSYMTSQGKAVATKTASKTSKGMTSVSNARTMQRIESKANNQAKPPVTKAGTSAKTGATYEAPKVTPRDNATSLKSKSPKSKDKSS